MIERKFLPLVVAVFVLMAGVTGTTTLAMLSDSKTVNVQISPQNVTATVLDNTSEGVIDPTSDNVTTTENETSTVPTVEATGGLVVFLDPADGKTVNPGETAEYDIVVKGATDGINGYSLRLTLSNSSVGSFEGFTHEHELTRQDESLSANEMQVTAGAGVNETIRGVKSSSNGEHEITLGTVAVVGNTSGQTAIDIQTDTVGLINETDYNYQIGAAQGSDLTVDVAANSSAMEKATDTAPEDNATDANLTAEDENYTTATNKVLSVSAADGVLSNDSGTELTASVDKRPSNGNLTLSPDGSFRYDPSGKGKFEFRYKVTDANGKTDSATVSITVQPGNGASKNGQQGNGK